MVQCPCGSHRVLRFRLDNDWASHAGMYNLVNPVEHYTLDDACKESDERPDIKFYECQACSRMWFEE